MRLLARPFRRLLVAATVAVAVAAGPLASGAQAAPASNPVVSPVSAGAWVPVAPAPAWGGVLGVSFGAGEQRDAVLASGGDVPAGTRSLVVQVHVLSATDAGSVVVWSPGSPEPTGTTVSFGRGVSSATTLVTTSAKGAVSIRSSVPSRLAVTVVGYVSGTGAAPLVGAGGTTVVPAGTVVDQATGLGGTVPAPGRASTVPLAGLAGVPGEGAQAVWLSVQARGATVGGVTFASPNGSLGAATAAFSSSWSTSLVLAALDADGSVTYSLRGSATDGLRVAVVGWVAGASRDGARTPTPDGVVPVATRTLASSAGLFGTREVSVTGADVPKSLRAAVVQVAVRTGLLPATLRGAATPAGALSADTGGAWVPSFTTTSTTLVVPVSKDGKAYVSASLGAQVESVTLEGYQAGQVAAASDTVAPTLRITAPAAGAVVDQAESPVVTIAGTTADAGSGVREVRVSVDGHDLGAAPTTGTGGADLRWATSSAVPAGAHTLRVQATDWAGRTTTQTRTFTVAAAAPTDVVVDPDAHVVSDAEAASLTGVGSTQVVFQGSAPVHAGDVLVSGVTPQAPEGLLRRVVSVTRSGDESVVETVPGVLTDVFVQAHVAIDDEPIADQQPGPVVDDVAVAGRTAFRAASVAALKSADPTHEETLASLKVSTPGKELVAKIAATARLSMTFKLDIDPHFGLGTMSPELEEFTFSINTRGGIDLDITAQKEKTWEFERQLGSVRIGGSTILVGPVPLVLTYSLDPSVFLDASIGGKITSTYELSIETRSGVTYTDGRWKAIDEKKFTNEPNATAHVVVDVSAGVILDFVVKVYDLAGPYIGLKVGPRYVGDLDLMALTYTHTVTLEYTLRVGARVAVLGKTVADWNHDFEPWVAKLYTHTYPYEKPADGTDPGPGGGGGNPGGGGTGGDPGDGGGDPGDGGGDPGDGDGDPGEEQPSGGWDVALVLDLSEPAGPMRERQRAAAHAVIDALGDGDRASVGMYSSWGGTMLSLTSDLDRVHAEIDEQYGTDLDGWSYPDMGDGTMSAISHLAEHGSPGQRRMVVGFGDGGGWTGIAEYYQALAADNDIVVHGVGFEPMYMGEQVAAVALSTGGTFLTIGADEDPVPAVRSFVRGLGGAPSGIQAWAHVGEEVSGDTRKEFVEVQLGDLPAGTAADASVSCTATDPVPGPQWRGPYARLTSAYTGGGVWRLDWVDATPAAPSIGRTYLCIVQAVDEDGVVVATQPLVVKDTDGTRFQGTWVPSAGGGVDIALTSWPVGTKSLSAQCSWWRPAGQYEPSDPGYYTSSSERPAPGGTWNLHVPVTISGTYRCTVVGLDTEDPFDYFSSETGRSEAATVVVS
ncbi:Ig-like domain-containing protein [Cellulomonas chitinilytica]|uniref:Ig-like domain-containing protein n=1 Tax=Cellulomonas chitinilytica TaxID=398759 RepID=UPI001942C09E|nr:Ig-like domain-containing protein [Cellulomonas chitinilytica]